MASSGVVVPRKGVDEPKGFLLSYDGSWHRAPFPEGPFEGYEVGAMAAASNDDIWLFASRLANDPVFMRFTEGRWSILSMPALPAASNFPFPAIPTSMARAHVGAMQFVTPTEGWAVGTKFLGGGELSGLVWHYEDGAWRNRNWNWHFWHQRWFGLFGL
jgi:hypothetical protein